MEKGEFGRIFKPSIGKVILSIALVVLYIPIGFMCSFHTYPKGLVCGGFFYTVFALPVFLSIENPLFAIIPLLGIYIVACLIVYLFHRIRTKKST